MEEVRTRISNSLQLMKDIVATARDVNKKSLVRKDITVESISDVEEIRQRNENLSANFEKAMGILRVTASDLSGNSGEIGANKKILSGIAGNLTDVGTNLEKIELEIEKLTGLVDEIQGDTNNIFSLALNASIVSSKYSNTSGVFDILANKLNEMSNFINQNLETIVQVVRPITEGVQKLKKANDAVMADISAGNDGLDQLATLLGTQSSVIGELIERTRASGEKITEQKEKIEKIAEMIHKMDGDAAGAIDGSNSVANFSQLLLDEVNRFLSIQEYNADFVDRVNVAREKSISIWKTAETVNENSKSQLEFSENAREFAGSILEESHNMKETAEHLNIKSRENIDMSQKISSILAERNSQFKKIENNIFSSGRTIQKFNEDYKQIDNILEFLKNILKSMHLIGMYSRIESARDADEFSGFMNISANITKLQKEIQNNIPIIEKNINDTHHLIDAVNNHFKKNSSEFSLISESSARIVLNIDRATKSNSEVDAASAVMLQDTHQILTKIDELHQKLNRLTEIVNVPIEGSNQNIQRGKKLEAIFEEMGGYARKAAAAAASKPK